MTTEIEKVNIQLQDKLAQILAMAETHGYIEYDTIRSIVGDSDV